MSASVLPRARPLGAALAAGLTTLTLGASALAYCRTTTCIPGEDCEYDYETGCALTGTPLEWKRPCVSFAVQKDGSPLRGISYDTAHSIIEGAYAAWLASSCDGALPSVDIADFGAVSCNQPQYNQGGPNANVWMFRDDEWDYAGSAPGIELAITIITFHPETGEIFDADVEINSHDIEITTGDEHVLFDLASIVTHEAGHFLGLSHTRAPEATMRTGYRPGSTALRYLSPDDMQGMCAIYPPNRELPSGSCTPRHGFSSSCYKEESGCSVAEPGREGRSSSAWLFGAAFLAFGVTLRRCRNLRSA